MKKIIPFVTIILFFAAAAKSQDIGSSSLRWNSDKTFEANEGQWTDETTSFTTNANTMEWKNADGSNRMSFQIIEMIGTWSNVTSEGNVQYEVTDTNHSGTVRIQKVNGESKILIILASEPALTYELNILNVQVL